MRTGRSQQRSLVGWVALGLVLASVAGVDRAGADPSGSHWSTDIPAASDPSNDNPTGNDARGDIVRYGGQYTDTKVTLAVFVRSYEEPTTSDAWRFSSGDNTTGIFFSVDTNGDNSADYEVRGVLSGGKVVRTSTGSPVCDATLVFDPSSAGYAVQFDPVCIASPQSFNFQAQMVYATPSAVSKDFAPDTGTQFVARSASGSSTTSTTQLSPSSTTTTRPTPTLTTSTTVPAARNNRLPIGVLDRAVRTPGMVELFGWAWDPDGPPGPTTVQVLVDGVQTTTAAADGARPDVDRRIRGAGPNRGYDIALPITRPGPFLVCVVALDSQSGPGTRTETGCRAVITTPIGILDAVTPGVQLANVRGWAIDPDSASPVLIRVTVDGARLVDSETDRDRPDVARRWPGYGVRHGFDFAVGPIPAGDHLLCVSALDVVIGTQFTSLGCKTVAVKR